jgi:hypothetical protein
VIVPKDDADADAKYEQVLINWVCSACSALFRRSGTRFFACKLLFYKALLLLLYRLFLCSSKYEREPQVNLTLQCIAELFLGSRGLFFKRVYRWNCGTNAIYYSKLLSLLCFTQFSKLEQSGTVEQ